MTVSAGGSAETLYAAKDVDDLLADPNNQNILDEVRNNKIKPLDDAFEIESNKVLGTSTANYFYGEDAAGTWLGDGAHHRFPPQQGGRHY